MTLCESCRKQKKTVQQFCEAGSFVNEAQHVHVEIQTEHSDDKFNREVIIHQHWHEPAYPILIRHGVFYNVRDTLNYEPLNGVFFFRFTVYLCLYYWLPAREIVLKECTVTTLQ